MRPQHARKATHRAQVGEGGMRGMYMGESMLQHAVCWLEKRVQHGMEQTTVDNVIKFSAYLFATNKIKTIVKMRETERQREKGRERAAACGTPC